MEHPEIYQELEELYEKEKYYIMYEKQNQLENSKYRYNLSVKNMPPPSAATAPGMKAYDKTTPDHRAWP